MDDTEIETKKFLRRHSDKIWKIFERVTDYKNIDLDHVSTFSRGAYEVHFDVIHRFSGKREISKVFPRIISDMDTLNAVREAYMTLHNYTNLGPAKRDLNVFESVSKIIGAL